MSFNQFFHTITEEVKKSSFDTNKKVKNSAFNRSFGRKPKSKNRTKQARTILSKKHGIKKAVEKGFDGKYVMKHTEILQTMSNLHYEYDKTMHKWVLGKGKQQKAKKDDDLDAKDSQIGKKIEVDSEKSDRKDADDKNSKVKKVIKNKESIDIDDIQYTVVGNGDDEYDVSEEDIMTYTARQILVLFHDMKSALRFEEATDEEKEEDDPSQVVISEPVIDRDVVLDKMENLGYTWIADRQDWLLNKKNVYDDIHTKQSINGRAHAASIGYLFSLYYDNDKQPEEMSDQEVYDILIEKGFRWTGILWQPPI